FHRRHDGGAGMRNPGREEGRKTPFYALLVSCLPAFLMGRSRRACLALFGERPAPGEHGGRSLATLAGMNRFGPTSLVLLVALLVGGACSPNTIIRRTALINAPQSPSREGQPLERGDVRITGHVS